MLMKCLWQFVATIFFLCCSVVVAQICNSDDPDSGGVILPAFSSGGKRADGQYPTTDPNAGMAVVYLVILLYLFFGVNVAADVFMTAIEVITSVSSLQEAEDPKTGKKIQVDVKVWNPTVANLTLMALGSSAPEILLSIIEIFTDNFFSGELGPSTIVGSAAFNLFCITAVCIMSVPADDTRRIDNMGVFLTTATFSLISYIWVYIILDVSSPDIVDVWEGVVTFALFPVLVGLSYLMDTGWFQNRFSQIRQKGKDNGIELQQKNAVITQLRDSGTLYAVHGHDVLQLLKGDHIRELEPEAAAALAVARYQRRESHTRAFYRSNASRMFMGKKQLVAADPSHDPNFYDAHKHKHNGPVVGFRNTAIRVSEGAGIISLEVARFSAGKDEGEITLQYRTESGTATAGEDFVATQGQVVIRAGKNSAFVLVEIIDDDIPEDDEVFHVTLSDAVSSVPDEQVKLVNGVASVVIVDNDSPGQLQMAQTNEGKLHAEYFVRESEGVVLVKIERVGGAKGKISCKYRTINGKAIGGSDFVAIDGEVIEFNESEASKYVRIEIIDDENYELDEDFFVELYDPVGCELGGIVKARVWIMNDDELKSIADQVSVLLKLNLDKYKLGTSSWKQQFTDALTPPPKGSGVVTRLMYVVSLPFTLLFAFVPPTTFAHGWLTFIFALMLIGLLTALIGDVAGLLGCSLGIDDTITAITFVALGTSLPDTFASRTAALMDSVADASIGNITGSNSVNVLLGLGLPWMVAAIYWEITGRTSKWESTFPDLTAEGKSGFVVKAGSLGFSVAVFSVLSVVAFGLLLWRRVVVGAELGGRLRHISAAILVLCWGLYIMLSTLKVYNKL